MNYLIQIRTKGKWEWLIESVEVDYYLRVAEALNPNVELRAIPVFETKYVCR